MSVSAYQTIVARSQAELDAAVAVALDDGKQPFGELKVAFGDNGVPVSFVQAMYDGSMDVSPVSTDTIEGNVATAQDDITALQADMTTAQADITTAQGAITALQASTPPANVGKVTLILGTKTVNTGKATATALIFVTVQSLGTVTSVQPMAITRVAGTSFTITSSDGTDTSVVAWQIVEPA